MTESERKPTVFSAGGLTFVEDMGDAYKAAWDWHELPIADTDPNFNIVTSGETLIIEQHAGRTLRLARFHQVPTYAGLLAGMPQVRDDDIERAVRNSKNILGKHAEPPAILRPRLTRLPPSGPLRRIYPPARLPMVTSIAEFESDPMDKGMFRSSAIVIWYQEHFGLPTDEHILLQLRDLDWRAHAWDWDT